MDDSGDASKRPARSGGEATGAREGASPDRATPLPEAPRIERTRWAGAATAGADAGEPGGWSEPQRGSEVGRYVILRPVGQGGMGVVYAAYDPDLDRKIALKLLRPRKRAPDARAPDALARARLVREAQAMARVSHANVCSVYDVGVFGEQVFVAMEYVEGATLHDWLETSRPWREVLRVLVEAGHGLLAAHAAGLVHRDFKPANVLIDRSGRPRVTDFGLARLLASEDDLDGEPDEEDSHASRAGSWTLTRAGKAVGTPRYMPPEQHLGLAPDARADQFSFCVTLYRALYGKPPFEPARMGEVVRALRKRGPGQGRAPLPDIIEEPPRDSKVPAWVRRAVLRGLSLDPAGRFPGMRELLEELSQEPRLVRRRWVVGAAAVALVAFAAGAGLVARRNRVCDGSGQLMAEVWNPEVKHRLEVAFAGTGKPFAGQVARSVTQALDAYANAWIRQSTEACLATRKQGVQTEELLSKRVVCLARRRADLRALTQVLSDADEKVLEKAVDAASALPALEECQDVEALANRVDLPADPARRAEIGRLDAELSTVKALLDAGRYKPALEQAQRLEPRAAGTAYRPLQAEARFYVGWLRFQLGEREPGAQVLDQAFNDAEAGRADRLKVAILNKLLFAYGMLHKWELADATGRAALSSVTRIGEDAVLKSDVLGNLGNLELFRARYHEAQGYLERAEALLPLGHPKRTKLTYLRGVVASNLEDDARAAALFGEALRQTEALRGKEHPDLAPYHVQLAWTLRRLGQLTSALEHAQASLRLRQAAFGPKSLEVADTLDVLGLCLLGLGRHAEAAQVYRSVISVRQEVQGADAADLQYSYDGLGYALLEAGQAAEAVEPLRKALALEVPADDSYRLGVQGHSGFGLAQALWALGQHPQALAEASRARRHFEQAHQEKDVAELDAWVKHPGERPPAPLPR